MPFVFGNDMKSRTSLGLESTAIVARGKLVLCGAIFVSHLLWLSVLRRGANSGVGSDGGWLLRRGAIRPNQAQAAHERRHRQSLHEDRERDDGEGDDDNLTTLGHIIW